MVDARPRGSAACLRRRHQKSTTFPATNQYFGDLMRPQTLIGVSFSNPARRAQHCPEYLCTDFGSGLVYGDAVGRMRDDGKSSFSHRRNHTNFCRLHYLAVSLPPLPTLRGGVSPCRDSVRPEPSTPLPTVAFFPRALRSAVISRLPETGERPSDKISD